MFLKIIVEQMSGHSIRGQGVCEIREKCTHIFHHCRTQPKKVSDDEGNGMVMTSSQRLLLVKQNRNSSPLVGHCSIWALFFSFVHQDGRPGDLQR